MVVFFCAALPALAAPASVKAEPTPKPIDPKPVLDKLLAFRDDLGGIYIVPAPDSFANLNDASAWVFYGDAKAVYQQRIFSSSSSSGQHYEWGMWAPRAKISTAHIGPVDNKLAVTCSPTTNRPLTQLRADETKSLFERVTFYPPLWRRQAKFLARDENGVYYYVDELRAEHGGSGHRVYVGQKGAMKLMAMTNVVSDSAGEIYATKSGQLKIIAETKGPAAFWIKGRKKFPLTVLEAADNRYLIYRDLGIYGTLGAICDDL